MSLCGAIKFLTSISALNHKIFHTKVDITVVIFNKLDPYARYDSCILFYIDGDFNDSNTILYASTKNDKCTKDQLFSQISDAI